MISSSNISAPVETSPKAPKERNDFISGVFSGKIDPNAPRKPKPAVRKEPDLSFFDGVKRYEAPKKQTSHTPRPHTHKKADRKPAATPAKKVERVATTSANLVKKQEIIIEDKITVKEFSEKM